MNYSEVYWKGEDLFEAWYFNYISRHGKLKSNFINIFLYEMTWAWKMVPELEHIDCEDDMIPNFTIEQKEMIYKYFHENPVMWYEYLDTI